MGSRNLLWDNSLSLQINFYKTICLFHMVIKHQYSCILFVDCFITNQRFYLVHCMKTVKKYCNISLSCYLKDSFCVVFVTLQFAQLHRELNVRAQKFYLPTMILQTWPFTRSCLKCFAGYCNIIIVLLFGKSISCSFCFTKVYSLRNFIITN